VEVKALAPADAGWRAELMVIEIPPGKSLNTHFVIHKGDEIGYVLSGSLKMKIDMKTHNLRAGEVVYLSTEIPAGWENPGPDEAKLLWIKLMRDA
jgi:quercetin dioxygenase-like cupin family protein